MPILPIVLVAALVVGLLVAAIGPALSVAEHRAAAATLGKGSFSPLEWERLAKRRFSTSVDAVPTASTGAGSAR